MKTFLQQDALQFVDETAVIVQETVDVVIAIEGIREGAQFKTWAEFHKKYSEFAGGIRLNGRREIEKYLSRIGLYFVENGDTKIITKIGDPVGDMLYYFYLQNDEPAISTFTATWRGENRELINKFLRDKPWEEMEGRLRFRDYGLSRTAASAIFIAKPETRLFEVEKGEYEINLPEGSLWKIDEKFLIRGLGGDNKRVNITCVCGKQVKIYRVSTLESGASLCCQSCGKRTTDFAAFYQSISDEGYVVVKDFQDARPTGRSRIILQCPEASHQEYSTHQDSWMNMGARCSACSMRHVGEKKTRDFLKSRGISYEYEVKFDGLLGIGGRQLSYDFMFELNGENVLLEIDGEQHFKSVEGWGGEVKLQERIEHDRRKDLYASQNGLRLVRIQNVGSDYDFILNSLEELLSGSETNHFGSLYQENESK